MWKTQQKVYHVLLFPIRILLQVSFIHSKCVCCVFILNDNIFSSGDDGTLEPGALGKWAI